MRGSGGRRSRRFGGGVVALAIVVLGVPAAAQAQDSAARSRDAWHRTAERGPASGRPVAVDPTAFTSYSLERQQLADQAQQAPATEGGSPVVLSIPRPDGRFERFDVTRGTTLSPELAAEHPEIRDYVGVGVDDPADSLSLVTSPEGAYAAIRGPDGTSYVEPRYRDDATAHVAFARQDLPNRNPLHENDATAQQLVTDVPSSALRPGPGETVPLRTFRLALINDRAYANFFGGSNAQVLTAKTALMARVNQIYRQDMGITMTLVPQTDALNLNTDAKAINPNGPCGGAACYTTAQLQRCTGATLTRTDIVAGQILGARNYDIGHLMLGSGGGGLAAAGVGGAIKASGCTGSSNPTGDAWGVDFVAHEMGHQFGASHTFNGTERDCTAGNRVNATADEPGSGSTIMAYAGICDDDNLQPHSDPYFSQASQTQIYGWVDAPAVDRENPPLTAVQRVSLRNFDGTDSFDISFNGGATGKITNGTNYTLAGIKAAVDAAIGGGADVTVTNWEDEQGGALDQNGFTVTFDSNVDEPTLAASNFSGASGFVRDAVVGGPRNNSGAVTQTTNKAPTVETAPGFTIPARTPFTLTATGTDANADTLTYLWEENDPGTGRALGTEPEAIGPLFRVFGVAQRTDTGAVYNSTPKNATTTNPARDFPDVAQVMADNTDAVNACGSVTTDAGNDCWSEYLPKVNRTLTFRVTARDGNPEAGGTGYADTALTVSAGAGPFRLTSQATNTDNGTAATLPVTWNVAGTDAAPVSTSNVRILLSTDDGASFPAVLAAATPNDGSETVDLPLGIKTTTGRIRIEAVGNVFYDVSRGRISIDPTQAPAGGGGPSTSTPTTTTSTPTTPVAPPLLPVGAPTAATLRLSSARAQNFLRAKAVVVKATVDRDSALSATGTLAIGSKAVAGARLKLKAAKGSGVAGRATTLKLGLTARGLRAVRSAVRGKRRVTASVSVRATPADAPSTVTKTSIRQKGR